MAHERPLAVVVLAAGQGKRIGHPLLPKVLLPLNGRPLLHYVLQTAQRLSPEALYVVVGFRGEMVEQYVRAHFQEAQLVWQREQRGTGHAVWQTAPMLEHFPGDVLVLPGDVPLVRAAVLQQLHHAHQAHRTVVSLLSTLMPEPRGYGRILRDAEGRLVGIVEERDATPQQRELREVNTGVLMAQAAWLYRLLPQLRPDNAQQEYYLTDVVALCVQHGLPVWAEQVPEWEQFQGVNTWEELERLQQLAKTVADAR